MTRLEAGSKVPEFSATDEGGRTFTSADFLGTGAVVYFYPAAFTSGCTTESCDFRDRSDRVAASGYRIVGVSPDDQDTVARFQSEYGLTFTLLADPDHTMAEAFGAWGIKKNYGREYEGLIRSTFVINPDGVVESAHYNVKATGHAERIVRGLVS